MSRSTSAIAIAILVMAVIAGVFLWYAKAPKTAEKEPIKTTEDAIEAITASPPVTNIPSSPVKNKVPELNPVDKANPFNNAYKNPFE